MTPPRRTHGRIPLVVPVEYHGFERFKPDRLLNIGKGGVFILTAKPFALGTKVQFQFDLPELSTMIHVIGEVVWSPAFTTEATHLRHPQGMGIHFEPIDRESTRIIDQYVAVTQSLRSLDPRIGTEVGKKEAGDSDTISVTLEDIENLVET